MPLQDLTPQLRTRLSRLERVVGWFVVFATLLLLAGLAYYIHRLAESKGWLLAKVPYFTFVRNASGLKPGDRVFLMGRDVGEITEVTFQPPEDEYFNVYVQFLVYEPYYGYLWTDSRARIGSANFLGSRFIEVTKGTNGSATYASREVREISVSEARSFVGGTNDYIFAETISDPIGTNFLIEASDPLTTNTVGLLARAGVDRVQVINRSEPEKHPPKWMWDGQAGRYTRVPENTKGFWIVADESPALTERLENVASTIERALPDFLGLTNKLFSVLVRADNIVSNTDLLLVNAQPILTNLSQLTAQLNSGPGALGELILPTNLNQKLDAALGGATGTLNAATSTLGAAETNMNLLSAQFLLTLENLANTTSNLNAQVQSNTNMLAAITQAVIHSDELVQGLKRHWLLRSAFKKEKEEQKKKEQQQRSRRPRWLGGK